MLSRIDIRRFKNINELALELDKVNILVGSNNAGKSSILQAVQFAISIAQTTTLEPNARWAEDRLPTSVASNQLVYSPLRDVSALAPGGNLKEAIEHAIVVSFEELVTENRVQILVRKGRNKNLVVSIDGQNLGQRFQNIEHPYSIYVPGLAGIPAAEEFKTPGIVRKAAARGDANNVFRNILWLLKQDDMNWTQFISDFQDVFPETQINVRFNPERDEYINATTIINGQELPIDASGTGVLQAIQILSYVNLYKPKILILDEPDAHLHPDNQRRLAKILIGLAEERDVQIFLSTHSRHLIDAFSESGKMHWLRNGSLVQQEDYDHVNILMDIGALDKGDRLTNGSIEFVFLTEDQELHGVKSLLEASGFNIEDVDIWSYNGCSKIEIALVLNAFIRKHAPSTSVILHRDRDYLFDEEVDKYRGLIEAAGIKCLITDGSDIESHFINATHINYLYPNIPLEEAQQCIDEATEEVKSKTLEKFINSRTIIENQEARKSGKNVNNGKIALETMEIYLSNKERYRHGKTVLKCLRSKLHNKVGGNIHLIKPSPYVSNDFLASIVTARLETTEV